MKVFIIILHFGDIQITQECVASLYKNEKYPFTIVIVNNMPAIYTPNTFSKRSVVVINNKKNLGFSGGVNVGIRYALKNKAEAICLLNNDTHIQKPFLQTLLVALQDKSVGIVGPAIEFKKNKKRLFDIGGKINKLFFRTSHTEVSKITTKVAHQVEYVSGCCMLIKKDVFAKSGLFDEKFFLYYEDTDFCLRAKKNGLFSVVVPSVVIQHELSKSAGKMSQLAIFHLVRSSIIFGKKYAKTPFQKLANRIFILFQCVLFFKANPHAGIGIAKALLHA